jgi:predicted O-methyltransferase YrrM
VIEKVKTLLWFLKRRNYWGHALALMIRKFFINKDSNKLRKAAGEWAKSQSVLSVSDALRKIGLLDKNRNFDEEINPLLISGAVKLAEKSKVQMGGPGDLELLYSASKLSGAKKLLETGVAYGWSSLALLASIKDDDSSRLISVDMPYPKMNNEEFVGCVVDSSLRDKWELIREPDRYGILKAIEKFGGTFDLCHYDSDKSYYGRKYAYDILWDALKDGGVFISDDIQDNMYFKEFVESKELQFSVIKSEDKYVGIIYKNPVNAK